MRVALPELRPVSVAAISRPPAMALPSPNVMPAVVTISAPMRFPVAHPPRAIAPLPQQQKYIIRGRDLRSKHILLPFGLPEDLIVVSAATLKKLVGAAFNEQLLKKDGDSWIFV